MYHPTATIFIVLYHFISRNTICFTSPNIVKENMFQFCKKLVSGDGREIRRCVIFDSRKVFTTVTFPKTDKFRLFHCAIAFSISVNLSLKFSEGINFSSVLKSTPKTINGSFVHSRCLSSHKFKCLPLAEPIHIHLVFFKIWGKTGVF